MKNDPFYVKDKLSVQLQEEEKERQQKKIIFMQKQREDYNN